MGSAIVTSAPTAFKVIWKMIRPLMDADMASRVHLLGEDFATEVRAGPLDSINSIKTLTTYWAPASAARGGGPEVSAAHAWW